jgi:hypothetical protein
VGRDGQGPQADDPDQLAGMLKPLGIAPQQIGPKKGRLRGYLREHFDEAFERYLPPRDLEPSTRPPRDEIRTSDISKPSTLKTGGHFETCEKPNNDGPVDGWTVGEGGKPAPQLCACCGEPGSPGRWLDECWIDGERRWLHRGGCTDAWRLRNCLDRS